MPVKKVPVKKNYKKRVYKKRAPKAIVNKSMVDLGLGFPKKIKVTHKYVEGLSLSSPTGSISASLYSCNGMYDPNISGGGHQPYLFDQMALLYNHYHVIGSHIKVTFISPTTAQPAICVGILLNDDTSLTGSIFTTLNETTNSKFKYISAGANSTTTLVNNWSAKKMFGKGTMANVSLTGNISSNPSEQSYFQLYAQALDLSTTFTVYCEVEITYIAIWNELKDISPS